jgi:hypothetical protein
MSFIVVDFAFFKFDNFVLYGMFIFCKFSQSLNIFSGISSSMFSNSTSWKFDLSSGDKFINNLGLHFIFDNFLHLLNSFFGIFLIYFDNWISSSLLKFLNDLSFIFSFKSKILSLVIWFWGIESKNLELAWIKDNLGQLLKALLAISSIVEGIYYLLHFSLNSLNK